MNFLFIYWGEGRKKEVFFTLSTKVPLLLERSSANLKGTRREKKEKAHYKPRRERCATEASASIQVNPSAHTCFKNYMHRSGGLALQNLSRIHVHVQNSIFIIWIFQISALNDIMYMTSPKHDFLSTTWVDGGFLFRVQQCWASGQVTLSARFTSSEKHYEQLFKITLLYLSL